MTLPTSLKVLFFLPVLCLPAAGCAGFRFDLKEPPPPRTIQGVVFAADGAGGWEATSQSLRWAVYQEQLPLQVETFRWSHGQGLFLLDQTSYGHAEEEGRLLAQRIAGVRARFPDFPVSLVGHSAGAAVVLAAAEALPPGSVEHIVLLAPSVSAGYDLRAALRGTRYGIDVFCSKRDWFYLGLGTTLVGNADRVWGSSAGRSGFRPILENQEDAALYGKLREHPWDPCIEWTGNHGGHYGGYQVNYLRAYILPILTNRR
jgi:pimeloyl-ACP methyl ester carboxylesterase